MKLLLQFPTLGRPEKFLDCFTKYLSLLSKENQVHFNINCDIDDLSMNNSATIDSIKNKAADFANVTCDINFDKGTNKISAINDHINDKDFDIVVCLSDDMIPLVSGWDKVISDKMQENFPDTDGCLHFNDGYTENKLITLSILGRKLYNYFGYIYHPDYKTLYCDDEFTQEVKRLNKVVYFEDVIVSHEHYSREGNINSGDYDYAAKKTLFYSGRDRFVFQERKKQGFPKWRITND